MASRLHLVLAAVVIAPASCTCGAEPVDAVTVAIRTAPDALSFGAVPVGARATRTLTLVSEGSAPYAPTLAPATTGDAGFSILTPCALPLDPGDFCEMTVAWAPAAEGAAQGAVVFQLPEGETLEVPLDGGGTPAEVVLSPANVDFGGVQAGEAAEATVRLENLGATDLVVPLAIDAEGFVVDGGRVVDVAVAAGASVDVAVRFVPARGGAFAANLIAEVCGPACGPSVALVGSGLAPRIEVEPRAVDFGEVFVGAEGVATVTVTNAGAGTLGVTTASLVSPTADLVLDPGALPAALAEGESVTLTLRYVPTTPRADLGASLLLRSSDPVSPQVSLPVDATSPGAAVEILPGVVHFGVLDPGASRRAGVVLRAIGSVPVTLTGFSVDSAAFDVALPPPLGVLAPGEAVLFEIEATATAAAVTAGGATGLVAVSTAEAGDAEVAVQFLSGTTGCQPRALDGNEHLGGVPVGQAITGSVTLQNIGDAPCTLVAAAPALGLPFDEGWSYSTARAVSLAPSGFGEVDVAFAATEAGTRSAFLTLFFQGAPAPLLVSATATGVLGDLRADPGLLEFGPTATGCPATPRTATFVNRGQAYTDVASLTLDPPTAPFSFATLAFPVTLAPGASVSSLVTPDVVNTTGVVEATLTATSTEGVSAQTRLRLTVSTAGEPVTETFLVGEVASVDVLFIVDNSGSMQDEQQILADNFGRFIETAFAADDDVDFHLGVTHTDAMADGGALINGYLTRSSGDIEAQFASRALVGIDGSGLELGLESARRALEDYANADNAGFLRADAGLSVVVITDEEDSGEFAATIEPSFSRPAEAYIESLRAAKGGNLANTPVLFSVVGIPGAMPRYETVAAAFGGTTLNIQSPDWGADLSLLGAATFGLQRRFVLSGTPSAGTVQIEIDGVAVTAFSVDDRVIILADAPPAGAVLEVTYLTGCS